MTDKDTVLNELHDEVDYNMGLMTEGWEYYTIRGTVREQVPRISLYLVM